MVSLQEMIDQCVRKAEESGKYSLVIVGSTAKHNNPPFVIGPLKESYRFVGSSFITKEEARFKEICGYADGKVDYIFIDVEAKTSPPVDFLSLANEHVKKSKIKTFKGNDITALACDLLVSETAGSLQGKKVSIIGAGNIGSKVAIKLVERGADVYITRRDQRGDIIAAAINMTKARYTPGMVYSQEDAALCVRHADVLIGFTQGYSVIDGPMVMSLSQNALIVDGGVGNLTDDAIAAAKSRGLSMFRLDIRLALPYVIDSILNAEFFLTTVAGTLEKDGKRYVAGGIIGGLGDFVVDNIRTPEKIIGVADGKGGILRYFGE